MAPLRKDRPAIGTTALAILVIIVIVVGGAIGISYPKSGKAVSASSTTATSAASVPSSATSTTSVSSSTTSSTSSASAVSSQSSTSSNSTVIPFAPHFNFTVEAGPLVILIAPGDTLIYPSLYFTPAPNQYEGAVPQNIGIGDELVDVNATLPSGLSIQFYGSNLTDTVYTEIDAGLISSVSFTLSAAQSIAPGNYSVSVEASSGTELVNYSFNVQVVQYLITLDSNAFHPGTLTVPVGTTVFWLNDDANMDNPGDVFFNTISAQSPILNPNPAYGSWSYTFTTPGTYLYHNAFIPGNGSTGTIIVTG